MARGRKTVTANETLEQQIAKAQEKVIRTRAAYDNAVDVLQKLLDKRDAKRKEELWSAVIKSDKSYNEILEFITVSQASEEN